MRITDVKINGIKNPLGFCYDYLNCSWRVTETASKKPAAAAVEVSASPDFEEILYRKEGADLRWQGEKQDGLLRTGVGYRRRGRQRGERPGGVRDRQDDGTLAGGVDRCRTSG